MTALLIRAQRGCFCPPSIRLMRQIGPQCEGKPGFLGTPRVIGAFCLTEKPTNGQEVGRVMVLPARGRVAIVFLLVA